MTILELATDLDLPSGGRLWHKLRDEGPDPSLNVRMSADLRKTLKLMMGKDHLRRPTVDQLLAMPAVQAAKARRQRRIFWANAVQNFLSFNEGLLVHTLLFSEF